MKWILGFFFCLITICFVIFVYLQYIHKDAGLTPSEKEKALTNMLGRAPILNPVDHTNWKTYDSSVISFSYPSWATVYTKDNTDAKKNQNILDSFHFGLLDENITGLIQVLARPNFSLVNEDPAVKLRLNDSNYKVISSDNNSIEFLNTQNGAEESYFNFKDGRIYSLVVSGESQVLIDPIFSKIKSSLKSI